MSRINNRFFLILVWMLFFAGTISDISATRYYTDYTLGNDSFDGKSPSTPWKSLDKTLAKAYKPGDTICFKGGEVWNEYCKIEATGTSTRKIVFMSYGEGRPCIKGLSGKTETMLLYNSQYVEVRDFEIDGSDVIGNGVAGLRILAEDCRTRKNIEVNHLYIHDVKGTQFKELGGGSGIYVDRKGAAPSNYDGLYIEDNLLRRCERNGITFSTLFSGRSTWFPSSHVFVRRNVLEQIPGDGIVPIATNGAVVEYNIMRDCAPLVMGDAAAGIWPWGADSTIIQFNEVSGHRAYWDGQGFDSDYNCFGTVIQYNYSHDNDGGFILICNDGGTLGKDWNAGTEGSIVRFNVSVNDGIRQEKTSAGTYFSPSMHISGPVKNTQIYNNIIYVKKKPSDKTMRRVIEFGDWGGSFPENTHLFNNIFYVEDGEKADYLLGRGKNTVFENNAYSGKQNNKPVDPSPIYKDPIFKGQIPESREERDGFDWLSAFRLSESSPCIATGKSVDALARITDFFGGVLPLNILPSIGIEYTGAPALGNAENRIVRFSQYPNPVSDICYINYDLERPSTVIIQLFDASGKLCFKKVGHYESGPQQEIVDTDTLYPGTYLLQMKIGAEKIEKKLIKN